MIDPVVQYELRKLRRRIEVLENEIAQVRADKDADVTELVRAAREALWETEHTRLRSALRPYAKITEAGQDDT